MKFYIYRYLLISLLLFAGCTQGNINVNSTPDSSNLETQTGLETLTPIPDIESTVTLAPENTPPPVIDFQNCEEDPSMIVFHSEENWNSNMFLYNFDSEPVNISGDIRVQFILGYSKYLSKVLFNDHNSYLYSVNLDGTELKKVTEEMLFFGPANLSSDGKKMVYESSGFGEGDGIDVFIYDLSTKEESRVTDTQFSNYQPTWNPDGDMIAYVSHDGQGESIVIFDLLSGTELRIEREEYSSYSTPKWSPDGKYLAFLEHLSNGEANLKLFTIESKDIKNITEFEGFQVRTFNWSPNSIFVAYSQRSGKAHDFNFELNIVRVDDLANKNIMSHIYSIIEPIWTSSGCSILYAVSHSTSNIEQDFYYLNLGTDSTPQRISDFQKWIRMPYYFLDMNP